MAKTGTANKGFASESEAKRKARIAKSIATRQKNKLEREAKANTAGVYRTQAEVLIKEAEELLAKADEVDGQLTSKAAKAQNERILCESIDERFKDTVSPQYLKLLKQYAIQRKVSAESLATPSFLAMDVIHDPDSSKGDKKEAMKMLQAYENAKPIASTDTEESSIGSVQDELANMMKTMENSAPR